MISPQGETSTIREARVFRKCRCYTFKLKRVIEACHVLYQADAGLSGHVGLDIGRTGHHRCIIAPHPTEGALYVLYYIFLNHFSSACMGFVRAVLQRHCTADYVRFAKYHLLNIDVLPSNRRSPNLTTSVRIIDHACQSGNSMGMRYPRTNGKGGSISRNCSQSC